MRSQAANSLIWLALIYLVISLLRLAAGYSQSVITTTFSQRAMNDLRHDVFAHLQRMPVQYFDQNPVGRLVTRVTNDIRAIDEMLASGVITLVQDVILIVAIVALMLALNWKLALVSFIILPFVILMIREYRRRTRVIYAVRKYLAALSETLAEHQRTEDNPAFTSISIERVFGYQPEIYQTSIRQMALCLLPSIIHVSSQVAVALIIWYGGGQILRDSITISLLMAFTAYIQKLFEPIGDFRKVQRLAGCWQARRIFDLMDLDPGLPGRADFRLQMRARLSLTMCGWLTIPANGCSRTSRSRSGGGKIALVGHTGSGKTSIVNLMLGMYPFQKGRILIDGKPLSDYALADIRSNIGIVQQDVFIFSGDIKENIALNNTSLSKEEIVQVAKYVNADKFISKLPAQYDEPVMERGATLSTGQRQLIAFARVLAYDPSIFILDEATSNIDTETEILIQDALKKLIENRTSIIIAHRLSTIQHVDRIIVLHKGEIVEEGSHFDLLDKKVSIMTSTGCNIVDVE